MIGPIRQELLSGISSYKQFEELKENSRHLMTFLSYALIMRRQLSVIPFVVLQVFKVEIVQCESTHWTISQFIKRGIGSIN